VDTRRKRRLAGPDHRQRLDEQVAWKSWLSPVDLISTRCSESARAWRLSAAREHPEHGRPARREGGGETPGRRSSWPAPITRAAGREHAQTARSTIDSTTEEWRGTAMSAMLSLSSWRWIGNAPGGRNANTQAAHRATFPAAASAHRDHEHDSQHETAFRSENQRRTQEGPRLTRAPRNGIQPLTRPHADRSTELRLKDRMEQVHMTRCARAQIASPDHQTATGARARRSPTNALLKQYRGV